MYQSHVEAEVAAAHSNGPEGQKCYTMHGHDWLIEVTIEYEDLDDYGWGPGFGEIKSIIRKYDHKNLNEEVLVAPSAENLARILYDEIVQNLLFERTDAWTLAVKVHEGGGNWVEFTR